jgi:Tol biopolymer transport system component
VISADGSTVVFESSATDLIPGADPNGDEYDLYVWRRATGAIERVFAGAANVAGISDDGSKVLFVVWEQGEATYRLLSTQTKTVTVLPKDPSLEYNWPSALSGDGTKLLYTARPTGTNYVSFIHLRNLLTGADQKFGDQTDGTLRFADAGNYVVYGTYHGFFNEGTAVINLSTGQRTVLDGGVNGVFYAKTSSGGKCIVLHSWENTALTADLPNRGEKVYYDDLFSYNLETGKYTRLTNTYDINTSSSGVAVANNCSEVAFDVPPGALDPDRQEDYEPSDVYVRRP